MPRSKVSNPRCATSPLPSASTAQSSRRLVVSSSRLSVSVRTGRTGLGKWMMNSGWGRPSFRRSSTSFDACVVLGLRLILNPSPGRENKCLCAAAACCVLPVRLLVRRLSVYTCRPPSVETREKNSRRVAVFLLEAQAWTGTGGPAEESVTMACLLGSLVISGD